MLTKSLTNSWIPMVVYERRKIGPSLPELKEEMRKAGENLISSEKDDRTCWNDVRST